MHIFGLSPCCLFPKTIDHDPREGLWRGQKIVSKYLRFYTIFSFFGKLSIWKICETLILVFFQNVNKARRLKELLT